MRCRGLLHLDATRSDEIRVQRSKFPAYLTGQIDYIVGIEYESNPPPPFPFAAIRSSRTKTCFAVRWGKLNWNRRRRGAAGPPGEWGRLRVLGRFDSLFFQGGLGMRFCFCKDERPRLGRKEPNRLSTLGALTSSAYHAQYVAIVIGPEKGPRRPGKGFRMLSDFIAGQRSGIARK